MPRKDSTELFSPAARVDYKLAELNIKVLEIFQVVGICFKELYHKITTTNLLQGYGFALVLDEVRKCDPGWLW